MGGSITKSAVMPTRKQSTIEYVSTKHGIQIKGEGKFVEKIIRRDHTLRVIKTIGLVIMIGVSIVH